MCFSHIVNCHHTSVWHHLSKVNMILISVSWRHKIKGNIYLPAHNLVNISQNFTVNEVFLTHQIFHTFQEVTLNMFKCIPSFDRLSTYIRQACVLSITQKKKKSVMTTFTPFRQQYLKHASFGNGYSSLEGILSCGFPVFFFFKILFLITLHLVQRLHLVNI